MSSMHRSGVIGWFANNPVAANLLMVLVIVMGLMSVGDLRKEAFPGSKPDSINISVSYDSGSARQSEEGLAIKIEEQLQGITGIRSITSSSNRSGVTVTVEMQSDYDLDTLLRDVKAQVDAISTFPADAKNPVISKAEREEHALWIQLYGDTDRQSLQQIAAEMERDLLNQPSINRVTLSGHRDPMMMIEIDDGRLQSYGLTLTDVEQAVNNNSSNPLTAVLRNESIYLQLKAAEQAYLKNDFAQIPLVTGANGQQVLLGDVADILDSFDDDVSVLSRFQGQESIGLQVVTTGLDDIADSVADARWVVDSWIDNQKLPAGIHVDTWYDRSTSIMERLQLLFNNALIGMALVFVLLAVFLNLTVAFWVAMGLPFVFLGTLFFMGDNWAGLSLNSFTTFGFLMALGIIVDDAVVVGESIYSVRSREGDTLRNTIKGTMQVAVPTIFGVLTTVAAFFSLSQIEGRLGELYAQFAAVVSIALLLSVVESKLILPAHMAHLNTHKRPTKNLIGRGWRKIQSSADGGLQWFAENIYQPALDFCLRFRYAVLMVFMMVFIVVFSMPFNGTVRMSFFPSIVGDTVRSNIQMHNDVSYGRTHETLLFLEKKAYETDKQLSDGNGSGIAHLQVLSEADHSGGVTVELSPDAPYNIFAFRSAWEKAVGMPEGVDSLRIQSGRGGDDPLRVELRSNDDNVLTLAGEEMAELLSPLPGIIGLEDNLQPGQPQLQLRLNQQGRALGLTTDQLAIQILQGFSGQVVQRYQRNSDEIEVKVRYPETDRQNPADVLKSRVRLDDGTVIPLSSVADVTYSFTRDSITRIDGKRAVFLSADVDKDQLSVTELVSRLQSDVVPKLEAKYPDLDIYFAGEAEEQRETEASMLHLFLLAMLAIYALLAIPLKSYSQPLIIMTAIPFGIVGAILGHWLNDLSLGILSLNGIIALSGVVVNDSLLLAARFNEIKRDMTDIRLAVIDAGRNRLRAVLLTSFTTFAGLVPLLGETSIQAQFLIPAAVSLAYGIMFATIITLLLIPMLLLIQHDLRQLMPGRQDLSLPARG
ncbi:efflux RND transporter permease subunit [Methylophaga sp. OBS3]|uniref:efflux RND transporter permease subunit n=1 Tax=Methylophaga sp. OBS3 TaxID=2991934 RepID=UPI002253D3E2|nr:efflux RND transporter permease subunit [Methylophaga sp. OBS3]MCX4190084.1 efflux RND transporter permease subunit [Methylophaga sp. OBS3]